MGCTSLDVNKLNGPLLSLLVNRSVIFTSEHKKNIHCSVLNIVMNKLMEYVYVIFPLIY